MLRIDIQNPVSDYQMFKVDIATILSGQDIAFRVDELFVFDVNQDGTEATVGQYSPYAEADRLTITGTHLDVSSDYSSLTGGHVSGFGYHKSGEPGSGDADISHVNLPATVLQGYIDDAVNGADRAAAIVQLQDELFDNRPQKIIGSAFPDNIQGGHADDIIHGNAGGDFIYASEGNDTIYGGPGKNTLDFSQVPLPAPVASGLAAHDGGGIAGPAPAPSPDGVTVDLKHHSASVPKAGLSGFFTQFIKAFEQVDLSNLDDMATGDAAGNSFLGGLGNDTISGKGGNDTIDGQGGDDVLSGNRGNDSIIGHEGNDVIHGGPGNDFIQGDLYANHKLVGKDEIYGGAGNDLIDGDAGRDVIYGGANDDNIDGNGGQDKLYGGPGNDKLYGGGSHDVIIGGSGNDEEVGGGGPDAFFFTGAALQGTDEILDLDQGDVVVIHHQSLAGVSFAQVNTDSGSEAEARYGDGSNLIHFSFHDYHQLHAEQSGTDVLIYL